MAEIIPRGWVQIPIRNEMIELPNFDKAFEYENEFYLCF